ncbi:hypothetical protein DPMN_092973 [Dreissena polymorpha]|uniref:Uncharacterized protein n=1 Tax=Dreissena polymorpha TaxID=45954 RepID=A0A9D4R1D8_DREPO|nr:hypothetical protein DPMN_092973 [Dreissena polymorpha]
MIYSNTKKGLGAVILAGLPTDVCSRARSHYCSTRELLPAVFPPCASTFLLSQPGVPGLRRGSHIDAELSADARSTQTDLTVGLPASNRPQIPASK